ncbi:hypothetical protein ACQKLX_20540 [Bosea sp. NPDC003192]|uniref:hypothetical protein n=1 Tax=Bosea sp. NPDC003192 TaxID=3390551 RepID=UPI003D066E3C
MQPAENLLIVGKAAFQAKSSLIRTNGKTAVQPHFLSFKVMIIEKNLQDNRKMKRGRGLPNRRNSLHKNRPVHIRGLGALRSMDDF